MCCECVQLKTEKGSLEQKVSCLEQELDLALQTINMMRYRMFGRRSEKLNSDQGQFDDLLAECDSINEDSPEENPETEKIEYQRRKKDNKRNGRVKIPEHLERVEKIIDLTETEKICPVTGLPMIRIGEEISEQLAYEPGRIYAIRYIRPKYASPDRRNGNSVGVKTAPLPDAPIERCKADTSLLTHILISKFCDHQPLHRQRQMFARHGIELAESSMGGWIKSLANTLEPLYDLHRNTILKCDYLNVDDTPILFVRDKDKKSGKKSKKSKKWRLKIKNSDGAVKGHMWAYLGRIKGPPDTDGNYREYKSVFFEFTENWNEEHPLRVLKNYKGHLQSDAYVGFKKASAQYDDITGLGCWSHARRKYFHAAKIGVKDAEDYLTLINILYRIEHRIEQFRAKGFSDEYLLQLRKKRANRVMNRFFAKVKAATNLPKSALGKALTYSRNQEPELRNYVNELRFSPDNNAAENILRSICLGKKNYMFLGNKCAGKTAAIIYSLVCSCKANDINPYEYFNNILPKINTHPHSKLYELLPHNWASSLIQK